MDGIGFQVTVTSRRFRNRGVGQQECWEPWLLENHNLQVHFNRLQPTTFNNCIIAICHLLPACCSVPPTFCRNSCARRCSSKVGKRTSSKVQNHSSADQVIACQSAIENMWNMPPTQTFANPTLLYCLCNLHPTRERTRVRKVLRRNNVFSLSPSPNLAPEAAA